MRPLSYSLLFLLYPTGTSYLLPHARHPCALRCPTTAFGAKDDESSANPLLKAAWTGAETLGRLRTLLPSPGSAPKDTATDEAAPKSVAAAVERLKEDYERHYFVTGLVDASVYAADCEFADPFAGFRGRDRFVTNLRNLGAFISRADIRPLGFELQDETKDSAVVTTRQMVKLELRLPWKPVLAWPWGVRHDLEAGEDGKWRCVRHVESWDIPALDGVKQVFRPGPEKGLTTGFEV